MDILLEFRRALEVAMRDAAGLPRRERERWAIRSAINHRREVLERLAKR